MDGAEAGVSSGPEHTLVVCEDPDTPRRPRQARKDPGRPPAARRHGATELTIVGHETCAPSVRQSSAGPPFC
jgi:hypothetical protein